MLNLKIKKRKILALDHLLEWTSLVRRIMSGDLAIVTVAIFGRVMIA